MQRALKENATSDVTFYNYGIILKALKRPAEALDQFTRALALNAAVAETWNNRGTAFNELKQYREAIADFDKALSINPNYADAYCNKGKALAENKLYDQSLAALDRALSLKPDLAEAWLGRGSIYNALKRRDDALAAYDKALALRPDFADAWFARGNILIERKQYNDAFIAYDKALAIEPNLQFAEGCRHYAKRRMCDWADYYGEVSRLVAAVRDQRLAVGPFELLSIASSPADQFTFAKCYTTKEPSFAALSRGEIYSHDRIRIAYLSADLHEHPIAYLIAGLFEQHDRSRFEITGVSLGPDQDSDQRRRIIGSFEHFIDARAQSDQDIAELILDREIDIAIDVNGYTSGARPYIAARRPAPLQVNYLGYPGTMGADFIDYILADSTVIPDDQRDCYSEKVIWLPDSYQVNDNRRRIAERTPTRGECALPEMAFVFACFNNSYKITPDIFDSWMRLLKAVPGSILWLLGESPDAMANLRREADKREITPDRLVFAPRVALADHLARHRQANLFLDTLPYNAHTTASDALWAGLPMVTCLGTSFAGRVAASLLKAAGLPELITTSLKDYEELALKLAQDPAHLATLKDKLARNRDRCPLFDTTRAARHIEAAYTAIWERHQKGMPPQAFAVEPIG